MKYAIEDMVYPIIHLRRWYWSAITHSNQYSEEYHSLNGQNTTQGGTHLVALERRCKTIREFYNKIWTFGYSKIDHAVSIKVMEPVLNLKQNKLGSTDMGSEAGPLYVLCKWLCKNKLDNFLQKIQRLPTCFAQKLQADENVKSYLVFEN
jgi:topoisomerase-4 subunit B